MGHAVSLVGERGPPGDEPLLAPIRRIAQSGTSCCLAADRADHPIAADPPHPPHVRFPPPAAIAATPARRPHPALGRNLQPPLRVAPPQRPTSWAARSTRSRPTSPEVLGLALRNALLGPERSGNPRSPRPRGPSPLTAASSVKRRQWAPAPPERPEPDRNGANVSGIRDEASSGFPVICRRDAGPNASCAVASHARGSEG
jgi:hypothetical protein